MTRLLQLQLDATDGIVAAGGVTYYPYTQEALPYWTNQVASVAFDRLRGEDIEVRRYTVQMRLILAHLTENYDGVTFDTAYDIIPAVLNTFEQHPLLTNSTHTTPLDAVFDPDAYHGAEVTAVTGPVVFTNAGIVTRQVGLQFTLQLPLIRKRY